MTVRAHPALAALLLLATGLAACGPVPVDQAERSCLRDAREASAPRSQAVLGVGTDGDDVGVLAGFSVSVSSDYITGRDPAVVFHDCVVRRSGQVPTRPLHQQPGYRS